MKVIALCNEHSVEITSQFLMVCIYSTLLGLYMKTLRLHASFMTNLFRYQNAMKISGCKLNLFQFHS